MPGSVETKKYISTAEDLLDDGLVYEVASSDGEVFSAAEDLEDKGSSEIKHTGISKKKRSAADDKLHSKKKMKMEFDSEQKQSLSAASSELIAEKLASKIAQQNKDLSPLELSELYIGQSFIKSTSDFAEKRSLDNLASFLKENFEPLLAKSTEKPKKKKTPKKQDKVATQLAKQAALQEKSKQFVAVISMSAIRSCDIHRATKELGSIKLIKKNKLKDDLETLDKSSCRILATTPNRIIKILNEPNSTINEKNVHVIVLDNSYLDSKKQNVLDIAETITFVRRICDHNPNVKIYLY